MGKATARQDYQICANTGGLVKDGDGGADMAADTRVQSRRGVVLSLNTTFAFLRTEAKRTLEAALWRWPLRLLDFSPSEHAGTMDRMFCFGADYSVSCLSPQPL